MVTIHISTYAVTYLLIKEVRIALVLIQWNYYGRNYEADFFIKRIAHMYDYTYTHISYFAMLMCSLHISPLWI